MLLHITGEEREGKKIAGLSNDLESQPTLGLSLTGSGSSLVAGALSGGMRRTLENGCSAVEGGKKRRSSNAAFPSSARERLVAKKTRSQRSFLSSTSRTSQWPIGRRRFEGGVSRVHCSQTAFLKRAARRERRTGRWKSIGARQERGKKQQNQESSQRRKTQEKQSATCCSGSVQQRGSVSAAQRRTDGGD